MSSLYYKHVSKNNCFFFFFFALLTLSSAVSTWILSIIRALCWKITSVSVLVKNMSLILLLYWHLNPLLGYFLFSFISILLFNDITHNTGDEMDFNQRITQIKVWSWCNWVDFWWMNRSWLRKDRKELLMQNKHLYITVLQWRQILCREIGKNQNTQVLVDCIIVSLLNRNSDRKLMKRFKCPW